MIRNAIWWGPVLAILGCITYFAIFSQFPSTRNYPVLNLAVAGLGLVLSLIALSRWRNSGAVKKFFIFIGTTLSLLSAGMLFAYVFWISYQMPIARVLDKLPSSAASLKLNAGGGKTVTFADFQGKRLVVSFFRGYW